MPLASFESLAGQLFYELHDSELGATSGFEDDVELGLLFSAAAIATACGGTSDNSSSSCGLDAVLILEDICELADLLYGEVDQLLLPWISNQP